MLFNWKLFPGTNLQDLNLDWIINFVKMIPSRLPKFSDHHTWLVYDYSTGEYYDSGEPTGGAGEPGEPGKSPIIGVNGNWYIWNNTAQGYVDTGTKAQGEQGNPGAGVASGGVAGNVLVKNSSTDYNTQWTATPPQMSSIAAIETSPATNSHAANTYLVYNGKMYKVISGISPTESLLEGVNIAEVTVSDSLTLSPRLEVVKGANFTNQDLYARKFGRIVCVSGYILVSAGTYTDSEEIATFPVPAVGYYYIPAVNDESNTIKMLRLDEGTSKLHFHLSQSIAQNIYLFINFCFVTNN